MKGHRLKAFGVALMGALALLFAGCNPPQGGPTTGTLEVRVVEQGTTNLIQGAQVSSNPQLTFTGSNPFVAQAQPGTYSVTASAPGYNPATRSNVQVTAGQTTDITIELTRQPLEVDGIQVLSVKDQWGVDLPSQGSLYASQTGEPVCVTVKVTKSGNPVPGARVRVESTPDVTLSRGCGPSPNAVLDPLTTDAQGIVKFTLSAAPAPASGSGYGISTSPLSIALTVSASGANNTGASTSFSVLFWDISHLYYSDTVNNVEKKSNRRTGEDLGTIFNPFDTIPPINNDHTFTSFVYRRPSGNTPLYAGRDFTGYLEYTLVSGNVNEVQWSGSRCNSVSGYTCRDNDASTPVILQLNPNVTINDLPISVQVRATLYVQDGTNNFPLKSYTFTKTWTKPTTLAVQKFGPQVIGWSGDSLRPGDVTLKAQGANVPAGATYTYTITVTNTGSLAAQNVVITDPLPAELGFVSASGGGTYDPIQHTVTWNIPTIANNASAFVTVTVYARHAPGHYWNDNDRNGPPDPTGSPGDTGYYPPDPNRQPSTTARFGDPYQITNTVTARADNAFPVSSSITVDVVRPLLEIVSSSPTPISGQTSFFLTLTVQNVDRAALGHLGYQGFANHPDYQNALKAYNVIVRELLGEGLDFVSSTSGGTLDDNGKTITFSLGDLDPGASRTIKIKLIGSTQGTWGACARLYANNLSQIATLLPPRTQLEPNPGTGIDPRPSPPYTSETSNPDTVGNYIEACSTVRVQ